MLCRQPRPSELAPRLSLQSEVLVSLGGGGRGPARCPLSPPPVQGHSPSSGQVGKELRSGALPPGHITRNNENPLTGSAVRVLFSAQFFLRTLKSSSQNGELWFTSPRTVTTERSKRGVSTLHPSGPTGPEINPINYYHPPFPAHRKSR